MGVIARDAKRASKKEKIRCRGDGPNETECLDGGMIFGKDHA
jgi:hypothetical protein